MILQGLLHHLLRHIGFLEGRVKYLLFSVGMEFDGLFQSRKELLTRRPRALRVVQFLKEASDLLMVCFDQAKNVHCSLLPSLHTTTLAESPVSHLGTSCEHKPCHCNALQHLVAAHSRGHTGRRGTRSGPIAHFPSPMLPGAVGATIHRLLYLDAVAQDFAAAVIAGRRELVNRTFKTVECVARPVADDVECEVILVATDFTLGHAQGDTV